MARKQKASTLKRRLAKAERTIQELRRLIESGSGGDAQRTRFHKGTESKPRGAGREVKPRPFNVADEPFVPITSAAKSHVKWVSAVDAIKDNRAEPDNSIAVIHLNPNL